MSADWIPFHKRLAKGPKRGLPRALRFVLLELSLEARATRGRLDLCPGWTTLNAVHDLIGGDRLEIAQALDAFADDALVVVNDGAEHSLTIPRWEEWAGPKTDAERQASRRARDSVTKVSLHPVTAVTPTGHNRTEQNKRGEDPERAPVREEPQSQTRMKSAPPPPFPPSDERSKFESRLRASPKLSDLDVDDLAGECLKQHMGTGDKVEWILKAIDDANSKSERGEQRHIRHSRVINFIRKCKPKPEAQATGEAKGGAAYQDFAFVPGELGPARARKRVTSQDVSLEGVLGAPIGVDYAKLLGGIGAPRAPEMTQAEKDAKRLADKRAVLAMDEGAEPDEGRKQGTGS